MIIETERLILRPWKESDAESLFEYAKDPEVGYWIGVPYWGNGYIPEAVRALQQHAFYDLNCTAMWCGYYDGNEKSKRCQEKCGFKYHHTEKDKACELMGDVRTEHFTYLTMKEWEMQDK